MGDKSAIEWTDATWNPVVGCSLVSPGCTNCFAMATAAGLERRFGSAKYGGLTKVVNGRPVWTGEARLVEEALLQPLRWRRGREIFVNSMSDLFHKSLPDEAIDRVFAIMALAKHHTFQVLTKRDDRMRRYLSDAQRANAINGAIWNILGGPIGRKIEHGGNWQITLPLPNVRLGTSVEDQRRADERVPELLATPAAVRFLSCEPLLGPLNLHPYLLGFPAGHPASCVCGHCHGFDRCPNYGKVAQRCHRCGCERFRKAPGSDGLHQIIVGGESGPGARPMHPDWARSLRDQCVAAGVAYHFKQHGEWIDERLATAQGCAPGPEMFDAEGQPTGDRWHFYDQSDPAGGAAIRVGKRRAGRLLDGRTWDERPS